MLRVRLFLATMIILGIVGSAQAQEDYSKWLFNVGGGFGFPQGDLTTFVNDGGNFVIGAGINFKSYLGEDTEYMWQDLAINSMTKQFLQTSGASARQHAWTFNPIVHLPLHFKAGSLCNWWNRLVSPVR
jgi:hypothetical protein